MGRTVVRFTRYGVTHGANLSLAVKFALCEHAGMEQLITFRETREMSQKALAALLGTSAGYLHDLESGRRRPSPALANRIERLTGIPREALLPDVFGPAKSEAAA